VLIRRVGRKSDRPLLRAGDPAQVLRDLAEVRYPVYALADITVDSVDTAHSSTVHAILQAMRQRLAEQQVSS
jgi:shikimate kinase